MEYYEALKFALNEHRCIRRKGWNASNQFVFFQPGSGVTYNIPEQVLITDGRSAVDYHIPGFLAIKAANESIVPWLCSAADAVASDWEIVPVATKEEPESYKPNTVDDVLQKNDEQLKHEQEG